MRVLFLSKRHPQQRDLIERPYGRFHHLPRLLAGFGHEVQVALCSHRGMPSTTLCRDGVRWTSHDIRTLGPFSLASHLRQEAESFQPDWIVGCSDIWYALLARRLASRTGARLAIDAYDNFEAYIPWNLPLHASWHWAIAAADAVTAAGPQLADRLDRHRPGKQPTRVVPMAADPEFTPHGRAASRASLGLPAEAPLIGYMGGWARSRGTRTLLEAFRRLRARLPAARLVLTGRPPPHALGEPGVLALGYVPDAQLPVVLSALDVASVITANSSFGRFSYPAKLCEAMACQVPVVATGTEPVRWMLANDDRFLVPVDDAEALASRMDALIGGSGRIAYPSLPSWEASARLLEDELSH